MDFKHRIELEKDQPKNREKRLKDNWPLAYPLALAVELSSDCNSNCYMCPRKNLSRKSGVMSFSLFKKIIDELHENKITLRKLFLYWMGEPLLNPDFDKMITYARELGVAEMIVMASNLIALDEEKTRKLINSQLDELFVSLDALRPETYDKIRGNSAKLKDIEANILRLVALKKELKSSLPYIRLKILKSDINKDEIEEFKKKWLPVVDEVYVEEDLNAWNGTDEDVNKKISKDSQFKENVSAFKNRWPCERLWYQMAISYDGLATPCIADWNGLGFIGDVSKNSLFDIWNSPKVVEMRRQHLTGQFNDLAMCKKCQRWIFRKISDDFIEDDNKALSICHKQHD